MFNSFFSGKRYIQYFGKDDKPLLGSDGVWIFDQRFSNWTALRRAKEQIEDQIVAYSRDPKKAVRPFATKIQVMVNERSVSHTCFIDNPHTNKETT